MQATTIPSAPARFQERVWRRLGTVVKFVTGVLCCLTPMTALLALGWLTRKTGRDIAARQAGQAIPAWPGFIFSDTREQFGWLRWVGGGFAANLLAGTRAWLAVLVWTLPFTLVWLLGWVAGWENSFQKGYELAGLWPVISLAAVLLSLPVYVFLPMIIAHQAAAGTFRSAFEVHTLWRLLRVAGWRYVGLTVLFGIGCLGVFGVRTIPVFSEPIFPRVASGDPELIASFARQFVLVATATLFTGLLVIRHVMARVYATAMSRLKGGQSGGKVSTGVYIAVCAAMWLGCIFLIYVAQFLNANNWSFLHQPVLMLPWLGITT